jgi:protein-tyrosine phosphatase
MGMAHTSVPSAPISEASGSASPRSSRGRGAYRRVLRGVVIATIAYMALWLTGAGGVLAATQIARQSATQGTDMAGIRHFERVDSKMWRGSHPNFSGYRALASMGVTTVVDLRAEVLSAKERTEPTSAGLDVVRIPVRDGQTPDESQVTRFLATVRDAKGKVFVHCGAGVGRTGAMSAAYLVRTGQTNPSNAVHRNLAVGPPSLEQVWYAVNLSRDDSDQPPVAVQVLSRMVDAPRRMLAYL